MAAVTIRTSQSGTLSLPISDPTLAATAQGIIDPFNALILNSLIPTDIDHAGGIHSLAGGTPLLFASDSAAALTLTGGASALFPPLLVTGTQDLAYIAGAGVAQLIASGNTSIDIQPGMGGIDAWLGDGDDTINAIGGYSTIRAGGGHNHITLGIGFNLVETAGIDTILAGPGVTSIRATGAVQDLVFLGSTYGTYIGSPTGSATIVSGIHGSQVVDHAASTLFFAAGTADFRGAGTVVGGSATIGAVMEASTAPGYAGSLVFAGTGHLGLTNESGAVTIVGADGGNSDIQVNAGAVMVFARGDTYIHGGGWANSSTTILGVAGTLQTGQIQGVVVAPPGGNSTINVSGPATVWASAAGDVLDSALASSASNVVFVGGSGAETLSGLGGNAVNTFFVGDGPTFIQAGNWITTALLGAGAATVASGPGIALLGFMAGRAPNVTFRDFDPSRDYLTLIGFGPTERDTALATATITGGNETIQLSDGTSMTFLGFTSLSAASFI